MTRGHSMSIVAVAFALTTCSGGEAPAGTPKKAEAEAQAGAKSETPSATEPPAKSDAPEAAGLTEKTEPVFGDAPSELPLSVFVEDPAAGKSIRTCSAVVTTPNFPEQYPSNFNSTLTIHPSEPGKQISVKIVVETEPCCDYLLIYDGDAVDDKYKLGRCSGHDVFGDKRVQHACKNENRYTSTRGSMTLHFESDVSVQETGMSIHVTCVDS